MAAEAIRDLEHRFDVDGRVYVVQVCGCVNHTAAPESAAPSEWETMIVTCAPDDLTNFEDDDPDKLADGVILSSKPLLPSSIADTHWRAFHDAIVAWVMQHRALALIECHEEWEAEDRHFRYLEDGTYRFPTEGNP